MCSASSEVSDLVIDCLTFLFFLLVAFLELFVAAVVFTRVARGDGVFCDGTNQIGFDDLEAAKAEGRVRDIVFDTHVVSYLDVHIDTRLWVGAWSNKVGAVGARVGAQSTFPRHAGLSALNGAD